MVKKYLESALQSLKAKQTPQLVPIPGRNMVRNDAGGYVFPVDDFQRLRRFLVLGSENGTYYVNETGLTLDNVSCLYRVLEIDPERAIDSIAAISKSGRATSNEPAIFALAAAASFKGENELTVRKYALAQLNQVCRTATHLFSFVGYVQNMRGWGRGLRKAVANWYTGRSANDLAYQVVKYRQRNRWTHLDLLRLSHPKSENVDISRVLNWIAKPDEKYNDSLTLDKDDPLVRIHAFRQLQIEELRDKVVNLIVDYRMPREALPTKWLKDKIIWEALLDEMPMTALIRNIGNMTAYGLLTSTSNATSEVIRRLGNQENLRAARIHPIQILNALRVYAGGRRLKGGARYPDFGQHDWTPVSRVVDALDDAFRLAFGAVEPTNKRIMLALDISASMTWGFIAGMALTPREASAAMALVTASAENNYLVTGFTSGIMPLDITGRMRLQDAIRYMEGLPHGGTDCSLPMIYATENGLDIDTFVVYTDNETWAGDIHPIEALQLYREKTGIPAKLITIGMTSTGFSIADPEDAGTLDVVGFDTGTPALISEFSVSGF